MATYQNSQGQYFNSQAEAAASNTLLGTNPSTLNTSASNNVNQSNAPINASNLGNVSNPVIPPPVNQNTAQTNLGTQVGTFTQGIIGNQQAQQEQAAANQVVTPSNSRQGILDRISSLLGVQATQGQETANIFAAEGVQAKKDLARQLEDKALATDRAYTKQAEKIRQNTEGKLESGVQIDLSNLERARNSELADIAIQQKIAQGNYQSAYEIADAKVKAQFEPIENQLKTLQNLYQLYGDDLTASEKLQAQAKIQEKQSALDFARQKELVRYKAQIDNAQAIGNATQAGVPAKIAEKIGTDTTGKKVNATIGFLGALKQYGDLYKQYADAGKLVTIDAQKNLASLRNDLDQKYSVANGQGAVQAGDRESYQKIISGGFVFPQKSISAINTLSNSLTSTINNDIQYLNSTYQGYATPFFAPQLGGQSSNQAQGGSVNLFTNILSSIGGGGSSIYNPSTGFVIPRI